MTITVHRAERRKAKLRLAIEGPSGSGKTYGALLIAKGLTGPSGRILLVDTERGSGDLYGNRMEYDVAPMDPPYTTEKYIEYIKYAEDNGYDCVILDSISHAWNGQGGILEQNSELAARGNNSFTSWAKLTPKQNNFVDAMLNSKIHVIATMRSKTEYAMTPDANGRMKPEKCGSAPIQRDGIDYEFTIVFDVALSHVAEATKDRSGLFNGKVFSITEDTGITIRNWLDCGVDVPATIPAPTPVAGNVSTAPKAEPVKAAPPQAPAKGFPEHPYAKSEIDVIRKNYLANGWNTSVFDEAQYNDEVWDADVIMADFRKRKEAEASAPAVKPVSIQESREKLAASHPDPVAEPKSAPVRKVKNACREDEARFYMEAMVNEGMDTTGLLEKARVSKDLYDKDIIQASYDEQKKRKSAAPSTPPEKKEPELPKPAEKPAEIVPAKPDLTLSGDTCEICGVKLLGADVLSSKNFCHGHLFCEKHQMEYIQKRNAGKKV